MWMVLLLALVQKGVHLHPVKRLIRTREREREREREHARVRERDKTNNARGRVEKYGKEKHERTKQSR